MRLALIVPLLAAAACTAPAQEAPRAAPGVAAPAQRAPTDVRRTTMIVRDIDTSLSLYRDVLGLIVNYDAVVVTSGVALPAGAAGARVRLVLMNGNDPWVGWVGFMQWLDPALPDPGPYPRRLGIGDQVFVMNTDDVDGRCAAAARVPGVTVTQVPRVTQYPGRDGGPPIRVKGCNFFDPDGMLVELNQIQP